MFDAYLAYIDMLSHKFDVIDTSDIVSVAQYILVVEKETGKARIHQILEEKKWPLLHYFCILFLQQFFSA